MRRFFIIGNPRSGTTLFRLMLNKHPDLIVPPESAFLTWLDNQHDKFDSNEHFVSELLNCKKIEHWNIDGDQFLQYLNSKNITSKVDFFDAVYAFYSEKIVGKSCKFYGDKNNSYLNQVGHLLELFPDAKFIHIVRDGRSVAASYKEISKNNYKSKYAPKLPSNIRDIAKHWSDNIRKVEQSFEKIPDDRRMIFKFEDLILNPEVELNTICQFIGVEFSSEMLKYNETSLKESMEPIDDYQWKKKNLADIDLSQIEKYKSLSDSELNDFENYSREVLIDYNYLNCER